MWRLIKVLIVLALIGGGGGLWLTRPQTIPPGALAARTANLANGEAIFDIGGCASCHATPEHKDRTRLGGGLELKTPFGSFRIPNISTDKTHGIGAWSEAEFVTAMQKGTGRRGEHLYPAFPYASYQRMRLDDVRDLYHYMMTLPAEATPSQPHALAFPFNVRLALGGWKLLFLDGRPFTPDPARDAAFNRGAYLVEGPGHCAECHSTRNLLGGITAAGRFAGGPDPEGKSYVPNITPHENGIKAWSDKDIAYMLETGFTPEFDSVGSTMADVVENTARLSAQDRAAMAAYLKSLPPRAGGRTRKKPE